MASIINSNLFNNSILGLKNSSAGLVEAVKRTLNQIDPKELKELSKGPTGKQEIIDGQTEEILTGEGGVSGFVERNFQDKNFTQMSITSPSLIKDPTELVTISNIPDTSFLDTTTKLQQAQIAFKNSTNIVARAQEEERGRILDLYDQDE